MLLQDLGKALQLTRSLPQQEEETSATWDCVWTNIARPSYSLLGVKLGHIRCQILWWYTHTLTCAIGSMVDYPIKAPRNKLAIAMVIIYPREGLPATLSTQHSFVQQEGYCSYLTWGTSAAPCLSTHSCQALANYHRGRASCELSHNTCTGISVDGQRQHSILLEQEGECRSLEVK